MRRPKQFSLFGQADKGILLFVAENADLFVSHRLPIALTALNSGYEVHVAAPTDFAAEQILESYAIVVHRIPLAPGKLKFFTDIQTFFSLRSIFKKVRPDIVHLIAVKPTLYGSIAARLTKIPAVVATITDLIKVGISQDSTFPKLIHFLYTVGFNRPKVQITFQSRDERDIFLKMGLAQKKQITMIRGTGVNMQQFRPIPELHTVPIVLLASRMRWDKGIREFVEVARQLQNTGIAARFVLVGEIDPLHPETIRTEVLQSWHDEGVIEWWGEKNDMPLVFAQAHIICLPSYREGLPKVLVEAAACGKPIVATDIAGCREIVTNEENGLLIPAKETEGLAIALNRLLSNPNLRHEMGKKGREKALKEFSIARIVDKTFKIYDFLQDAISG